MPKLKRVADIQYLRESGVPELAVNSAILDLAESMDWESEELSFLALRNFCSKNYQSLREAHASQAFGQLLRVGIQQIANGWYERTEVGWPGYAQEVGSGNRQEFYAPLFGSQLPKRTGRGERYTEQRLEGVDREIINYKYMGGESFERELFDDDQTGQIRTRAQRLGEGQRILEEAYIAGRMHGTATTIAGVSIPASTYSTKNANGTAITTPFSVNLYETGKGNRPATYIQLSYPQLKIARAALLNAKDPLGVKLLNHPNILLVSSQDVDNAAVMANSEYFPAVQGRAGETVANAASGFFSGVFSKNIFKGMMTVAVNIYLADWAWYLGSKKGLVFQRRDPMEVVQEVPNSGASFELDTIRFRTRSRWEADWIESRFWYEGNDGTVAGTQ